MPVGGATYAGYLNSVNSVSGGSNESSHLNSLGVYDESADSKKKLNLVYSIASDIKQELGASNVKTSGELSEVVKSITSVLPKKDSKVKNDAQVAMCKTLAKIVNKRMGKQIVSQTENPDVICQKVGEVLNSLAGGLHREFVSVHNDVKRVLNNVNTLNKTLVSLNESLANKINECTDGEHAAVLKKTKKFADEVQKESERQLSILKNLLNVSLSQADTNIVKLLGNNRDLKHLVKKVGDKPKSATFGRHLAQILTSLGTVAQLASEVDDALKVVGMSVEQYRGLNNMTELRNKVGELLKKKHASGISSDELNKILVAANILYKNNYEHTNIAKALEKNSNMQSSVGGRRHGVRGGAPPKGMKLAKDLKKQNKTRNLLLREFNTKMRQTYTNISDSVDKVAPKFGVTVPIDDKLEDFVRAFDELETSDNDKIYFALVGVDRSSAAITERSKIIGFANAAADKAEKLGMSSGVEEFYSIAKSLRAVGEVSDMYKDLLSSTSGKVSGGNWKDNAKSAAKSAKKHADASGLTDYAYDGARGVAVDYVGEETVGMVEKDAERLYGGALSDVFTDIRNVSSSAAILNGVNNRLKYYMRIANVRDNLKNTASEIDSYAEDYEKVLGETVGCMIKNINEEYERVKNNLANDTIKKYWKDRIKATHNLLLSLQAIDLYLKEFTQGLASNPDDISDILKLLDSFRVIARWYNDRSTNTLTAALEQGGNPRSFNLTGANAESELKTAMEQAEKVVNSVTAFKNFVSAFFTIGNKFGGDKLSEKIFMTPYQVYQGLLEYMKFSVYELYTTTGAGNYGVMGGRIAPTASVLRFNNRNHNNIAKTDVHYLAQINTDTLFEYAVKSMMAKILTTVGAFNVFNRPGDTQHTLSEMRVIMGGAGAGGVSGGSVPDVIDGAMELYIRLPLLAEFYRNAFSMTNAQGLYGSLPNVNPAVAGNITHRIVVLPEVDNVFSRLIEIVFDETKYLEHGTYSNGQIRELVSAINEIYRTYKSKTNDSNLARYVMQEFVKDINRRYAVAQQDQVKQYNDIRNTLRGQRSNNNYSSGNNRDIVDYEILDGESDGGMGRGIAPSDKYTTLDMGTADDRCDEINWHSNYYDLIRNFRDNITRNLIGNQPLPNANNFSLKDNTRNNRKQLKNLSDPSKRFDVVVNAIQGSNNLSGSGYTSMMAFHELVIYPIIVLLTINNRVDAFVNYIRGSGTNPSQNSLEQLLNEIHRFMGGQDGLVKFAKAGANSYSLDTNGLVDCVKTLLGSVKENINSFRSSVHRTVIDEAERCLGRVEASLWEELVIERQEGDFGLNRASNKISQILNNAVTNGVNVSGAYVSAAPGVNVPGNTYIYALDQNDKRQQLPNPLALNHHKVGLAVGTGNNVTFGNANNNLRYVFNDIVDAYLKVFIDNTNDKIYGRLVNAYVGAEGADDVNALANPMAPNATNVLSQALANVLYNLSHRQDRKGDLRHITNDMSEVTEYMKERMRAYLPRYVKILDQFITKCKMTNDFATAADKPQLSTLINHANSLKSAANNVHRELEGSPGYLDLYRNFTSDYKSQNDRYPYAPLSLLSSINEGFTETSNNTTFKLQYGSTKFMGDNYVNPSVSHTPWLANLVSNFNNEVESNKQVTIGGGTKHTLNDLVSSVVQLMRLYKDARVYSSIVFGVVNKAVGGGGADELPFGTYILESESNSRVSQAAQAAQLESDDRANLLAEYLQEAQSDILKLNKKIKELEKDIEENAQMDANEKNMLSRELNKCQNEKKKLEESVTQLSNQLKNSNDNYDALLRELNNVKQKLKDCKENNNTSEEEIEKLKQYKKELGNRIGVLEEVNKKLLDENKKLTPKIKDCEEIQAKMNELENDLKVHSEQIEEYGKREENTAELEKQIQRLRKELDNQMNKIDVNRLPNYSQARKLVDYLILEHNNGVSKLSKSLSIYYYDGQIKAFEVSKGENGWEAKDKATLGGARIDFRRPAPGMALPGLVAPAPINCSLATLSYNNVDDILMIIESRNPDRDLRAKVDALGNVGAAGVVNMVHDINNRDLLRRFNIIDMNIVPINVHALMREIPFANMLNYSYTFEKVSRTVVAPDLNNNPGPYNAARDQFKLYIDNPILYNRIIQNVGRNALIQPSNITSVKQIASVFTDLKYVREVMQSGLGNNTLNDSIIVRMLVFSAVAQHVVSLNLRRELAWNNSPVARQFGATGSRLSLYEHNSQNYANAQENKYLNNEGW